MESKEPTLFVIAGPNGAGKSTHSQYLLPDYIQNTDVWDFDAQFYFFRKLALTNGETLKKASTIADEQVSNLFNEKRKVCMKEKISFAYEGHFTSSSHWQPLLEAKRSGFFVHLVYLGLSNVMKSIGRVQERVNSGGHYVNEQNIRINYFENLDMLDLNFRLPHQVDMYETDKSLNAICTIKNGIVTEATQHIPGWIKDNMPQLYTAIKNKNI